jgi:hypothetical protein
MTDFDIDYEPGIIYEELNNFNSTYFDNKMKIEVNLEKKWIKLDVEETEESSKMLVKLKFFELESDPEMDEEVKRYRVRIVKKRGEIAKWYEIFK